MTRCASMLDWSGLGEPVEQGRAVKKRARESKETLRRARESRESSSRWMSGRAAKARDGQGRGEGGSGSDGLPLPTKGLRVTLIEEV